MRKASILFITLWILFLLGIFSIYLAYNIRLRLALFRRLESYQKLFYIADAGIKEAIVKIRDELPESIFSFKYNFSQDFKEVPIEDSIVSLTFEVFDSDNNRKEIFGISDEESKININKADLKTLKNLIKLVLGYDEERANNLASSIIDWRDQDNILTSPYSAESFFYQGFSYPYEAKNSDFEILDELLLVKDIEQESFERLKNFITLWGEGKVNINTASSKVLLALGFEDSLVEKIISFRQGEDREEGTEDDRIFEKKEEISRQLASLYSLSDKELTNLINNLDKIETNSYFFNLKSLAYLKNNPKDKAQIQGIVNRKGKIFYYQVF